MNYLSEILFKCLILSYKKLRFYTFFTKNNCQHFRDFDDLAQGVRVQTMVYYYF